jgi:rifampicin phosphotransferase
MQTMKETAIPVPAGFPVTWERPEDASIFWQFERMHFPDPMTEMDYAFVRDAHIQFSWALEQYGMPMRYNSRRIGHRWYMAITPVDAPPEQLHAMGARGHENLQAAVGRLDELWNGEWLPEIQQHLAHWESFDLAGAEIEDLRAHFVDTIARFHRSWQIHFLQTFPVYLAMSAFEELHRELFADDTTFGPYRLLQGLGNATVESGRALWRLSRQALATPSVRRAIEGSAPDGVIAALEISAEGREFLIALRGYLATWGKRGEKVGISYPSWIEDPAPVILHLQDFVRQPERNVEAETAAITEARERSVAEARERLFGYPRPVVEQFEASLRAAQLAVAISEDHNYPIDFQTCYHVRRVLLEIGHRLVQAGHLDAADDVLYLWPEELIATLESNASVDRRALVAERRAQLARSRELVPPRVLGTLPDGPPPNDPLGRAVGKFFGAPPPPVTDASVVSGTPGSPGKARGVARVIRFLDEAAKLRAGDVLVAELTTPSWTSLFGTAAAVVTDTGGVLSHCAVVAREYGIPAVVGTGEATTIIEDGQLVEVDGDTGVVRILATF